MDPAERKAAWRQLEAEFRPHITFDGIPYLEEGTRWQYQMHIYETPFYYIDYCLAQTAALQFLLASRRIMMTHFTAMRFLSQGGRRSLQSFSRRLDCALPFRRGASHRGPGERGTAERIGACALPRNEVSGARFSDK